jgi:hypothetical protein
MSHGMNREYTAEARQTLRLSLGHDHALCFSE